MESMLFKLEMSVIPKPNVAKLVQMYLGRDGGGDGGSGGSGYVVVTEAIYVLVASLVAMRMCLLLTDFS